MKVNKKNRPRVKRRQFQKLLARQGLIQKWVGAQLGYPDYVFSRILRGYKPFPPAKVSRLAALVNVSEKTIKEIFRVDVTDPS
jgi:hypothetical protein